jgi:hypothetical protein
MHAAKGYKSETLFLAVNILDRYLFHIRHWTVPLNQYRQLAVVIIMIAAKVEQPTIPRFSRILQLLPKEEADKMSVHELYDLELKVLSTIGFDVGMPSPTTYLERFLRIMKMDKKKMIHNIVQ